MVFSRPENASSGGPSGEQRRPRERYPSDQRDGISTGLLRRPALTVVCPGFDNRSRPRRLGRSAAGSHGRGLQYGVDREGADGRYRRFRSIPHCRPATWLLQRHLFPRRFRHSEARRRRAVGVRDRHDQFGHAGRGRRGNHYRDRRESYRGRSKRHPAASPRQGTRGRVAQWPNGHERRGPDTRNQPFDDVFGRRTGCGRLHRRRHAEPDDPR